MFGKMAQNLANYLNKGKQVFVEGRINNRSYDDKDGNKKYISEIVAANIVLLGAKGGGGGAEAAEADYGQASNDYGYAGQNGGSSANTGGASNQPNEDDDIPF